MQKVKHPHDEIIRAWLDGEQVEKYYNGQWIVLCTIEDFMDSSAPDPSLPGFSIGREYRIKPKVKTATVYVYMDHLGSLFSSMGGPLIEEQMAVRSISLIYSHEFTYTEGA